MMRNTRRIPIETLLTPRLIRNVIDCEWNSFSRVALFSPLRFFSFWSRFELGDDKICQARHHRWPSYYTLCHCRLQTLEKFLISFLCTIFCIRVLVFFLFRTLCVLSLAMFRIANITLVLGAVEENDKTWLYLYIRNWDVITRCLPGQLVNYVNFIEKQSIWASLDRVSTNLLGDQIPPTKRKPLTFAFFFFKSRGK